MTITRRSTGGWWWRTSAAALIASLGMLAALAPGGQAPAGATASSGTPFTFMLDYAPNPDQVAFYYGLEKGYFTKVGLDVQVEVPGANSYATTLVGTGKVDMGISYPGGEYAAALQKIPDEGVGVSIPTTLDAVIISPKAGITTIKGLKGKTVGYDGVTGEHNLQYLLQKNGVNPNTVTFIHLGTSILPALIAGKVQAVMGTLTNIGAIQVQQQMHEKPVVFTLTQEGYPLYPEFTLIANKNRLASSASYRSEVEKFLSAYVAAEKAVVSHATQAEAILAKVTQYTKPFLALSVPVTLKALVPPAGQKWGCFDVSEMQTISNFFTAHKVTIGKLDVSDWLTNSYLPKGSC